MNLEHFKAKISAIVAGMTTKELKADLIMRGAKLQRTNNTPMNDQERILEDIKQVAFDTISDYYFEGRLTREEWDEYTDKIEELNTEPELAALVRQVENGLI